MENKYDVFTKEKIEELSRLGYELKKWAEQADLKDQYEKGVAKGIEKGIKLGIELGIKQVIEQGIEQGIKQGIEQGAYNIKLDYIKQMINLYYPNEQTDFLNELTIEQLDMVFKQLLHQLPLDKIKALLN